MLFYICIGKVWNDYMKRIMSDEDDWDHIVETNVVVRPVVCESTEEVLQVLEETKT